MKSGTDWFLAGGRWEALDRLLRLRAGGIGCHAVALLLRRVQIKNMRKKIDGVPARGTPLLGLRWGLPGEVLLQRHHLPPARLRRRPLPPLHTQMLFDLQLQITALLDQRRCRCSCRETRTHL